MDEIGNIVFLENIFDFGFGFYCIVVIDFNGCVEDIFFFICGYEVLEVSIFIFDFNGFCNLMFFICFFVIDIEVGYIF